MFQIVNQDGAKIGSFADMGTAKREAIIQVRANPSETFRILWSDDGGERWVEVSRSGIRVPAPANDPGQERSPWFRSALAGISLMVAFAVVIAVVGRLTHAF